jgi:hypothetical protein
MAFVGRVTLGALSLVVLVGAGVRAQDGTHRLTTIDALGQFPVFYHMQPVLLRGEVVFDGLQTLLHADERTLRLLFDDGVDAPRGAADVRGLLIDVGRLEPDDARLGPLAREPDTRAWPRPGEELVLRVSSAIQVPPAGTATVRSVAIEPWRYEGRTVTIVGNFRGRNLFGDLADAPGRGPHDFVLRGSEGAIWITELRPRGRGFDLDVNRRVDTNRWLEVTGRVVRENGLVRLEASRMALADPPGADDAPPVPAPAPRPLQPLEIVFSAPTDGETDVPPGAPIRLQFSRGLDEDTLEGHLRVRYQGDPAGDLRSGLAFTTSYDTATRAVRLDMAEPLEPFRTIRVEVLDGVRAFDGGSIEPWTLTFTTGQ